MDSKLKFKPSELIDIGIDKLTKIPVPIISNNIISTFNIENGLPSDSFILIFESTDVQNTLSMTLFSTNDINLSINFGDGYISNYTILTGGTFINYTYSSSITYNVTLTGWLDKISNIIINGGLLSVNINNILNLKSINLSDNKLTSIDLSGLISLNNIILDNNNFPNSSIDDIYIETDTFLSFNGNISTLGENNGRPTIYSNFAINSLINKGWVLNYNN